MSEAYQRRRMLDAGCWMLDAGFNESINRVAELSRG
jgi:hypothetical protein